MNAFDYAMALISIIVGLGITHILSNLGTAVHRLRHHGPAIRLESNYLAWIAFVFCWLVNFWWWEFKWSELTPTSASACSCFSCCTRLRSSCLR